MRADGDEAIRFRERQRLEQHAAHHGKDRRVGARAERQQRDGDNGKTRPPEDVAKGEREVGQSHAVFDEAEAQSVGLGHPAKAGHRRDGCYCLVFMGVSSRFPHSSQAP